jgi:hypothetical protein
VTVLDPDEVAVVVSALGVDVTVEVSTVGADVAVAVSTTDDGMLIVGVGLGVDVGVGVGVGVGTTNSPDIDTVRKVVDAPMRLTQQQPSAT